MNNYFIDTHAHIYSEYYDDIDDIIKKSNDNNIKYIINAGCDVNSNEEVLKLSKEKKINCVIGYHPEYASEITKKDLDLLENQIKNNKILGIGEIGLDYHYEGYDKDKQLELFCYQLDLAQKYNLPVVIHSRDATEDTINTLKKYNVKGIIHSFSGSFETAKIYTNMGFLLGVNGVVTFKNCHTIDVIKKLGINYFVLETDSPYLTPTPIRGTKNYPGNVKLIVSFLCENLGITEDYLAKVTNNNALSIFDIK